MSAPIQAEPIENGEDDEVIAEYDVFITPDLADQIYLLQYPNRASHRPYNAGTGTKPLQMRLKPRSGFMELDVGMNPELNFNKAKGIEWGRTLREAKESGTNAFGLASGFGKGARTNELFAADRAQVVRAGDEDDQTKLLLERFKSTVVEGKVMDKQTLGGQINRPEEGQPLYMLGAFRENELHLTSISGTVQMRPQFHHIDAQAQISKLKLSNQRATHDGARANEPRLVQQTARTAADDDELNIAKTNAFLSAAAEEPWLNIQWHDEEAAESYMIYNDSIFIREPENAVQLVSKVNIESGKYIDAISEQQTTLGKSRKRTGHSKKQGGDADAASDVEEIAAPAQLEQQQETRQQSLSQAGAREPRPKGKGKGRAR